MKFQKVNNITGWVMFAVALITYWLTMEETASYWDCGEFIAVSYKLQVPHPPGAPFFLLLGRMFSFLAFGDLTKVAYWINFMSVLASAFTILFLFWTIVLFGRKMIGSPTDKDLTDNQIWMLMGAGAVGALAYTFSDSFWFSAVEAEVYAMSSFFTAFVVWGVLKWDVIEDESKANRWLLLVAYMMGLSIGVHMLNLVTVPALGLIYYFKKFKPSFWGIVAALMISVVIVLFINDFIVPGLPSIAGVFELSFVNTFGMFFGSGAMIFTILLIGAMAFGIYYTQKKDYPVWNTFLLGTTFILIGYSSYATILIRSDYDTLINENAPKDVMSFVRYLKREQYGSRPLAYGPYFTAEIIGYKDNPETVWTKGKDKYEATDKKTEYLFDPTQMTILPRLWYPEGKDAYESIMGLQEGQKPTFGQNLAYMFSHQIGWMYGRYFMWNFVGRESDEQGADWLGPRSWFKNVPEQLAENQGRNNFFMIPFLLGLLGMFFQLNKDTKNFSVIALLFVMLGVAIVVYLNSPPTEPRERDYIYAGSYYAFAMWIGLAVIGLTEIFQGILKKGKGAVIAATLIGLTAPALMAKDGWDDHNRSDRFFSVDSATNYLDSCAPNGIIFTGGDNDTFPLWYAQETEGFRNDLRVIVLTYYNTDWYIDQTMRKAYKSEPFKYTLSLKQYQQGGPNDYLPFADVKIASIDATQYINLISKDYKALRDGDRNIVPSRVFTLNIDKEAVLAKGIIPKGMDSLVVDQMQIRLLKGGLEKKDLALLDLLVTNNKNGWERPIYLNHTSLAQINIDLSPYAVQEGNAYRILPVRNPRKDRDYLVNTEKSMDIMMNKFRYRGLDDPSIYYTDDYRGFVVNHRSSLNSLAQALIDENQLEKADKVLMFSLTKMPDKAIRYDHTAPETIDLLFQVGEKDKAIEIAKTVGDREITMGSYLMQEGRGISDLRKSIFILNALQRTLYQNGEADLAKKYEDASESLMASLQIRGDLPRGDR
ncbi:MAG: protein O-mannosyl-transferase family [Flammeovirgaceae bacterium]